MGSLNSITTFVDMESLMCGCNVHSITAIAIAVVIVAATKVTLVQAVIGKNPSFTRGTRTMTVYSF